MCVQKLFDKREEEEVEDIYSYQIYMIGMKFFIWQENVGQRIFFVKEVFSNQLDKIIYFLGVS